MNNNYCFCERNFKWNIPHFIYFIFMNKPIVLILIFSLNIKKGNYYL